MGYLRTTLTPGGAVIPGHNGGRSQTNPGGLQYGEWPFINILKNSPAPITGSDPTNIYPVTPDVLNSDGYPLATGPHGGYHWVPDMPSQTERPGNYIITWDGTGSITAGAGGVQLGTVTFSTGSITGTTLTISGLSGTIQPGQRLVGGTVLPYTFIMSGSGTTWTVSKSQTATGITGANGGSASSSGGSGAGFYAVTVDATSTVMQFYITVVGSPIITNVQIYHVADAALVAAGEIFRSEFITRLVEANFGVLRFVNWEGGNFSNVTTWRTRKPVTYATYIGDQLNNSFYAGNATHTGNAYVSSQFPATHSSDGTAWTSGGPKSGDTVHVNFTNSATQSGTCSLSINGSTPINILNRHGGALSEGAVFYPIGGTDQSVGTLTYDASLNGWILYGGNGDQYGRGLTNFVPVEIMVQLSKEVGAHPYFTAPMFTLDPATDYFAELAAYCKAYAAANATWMIPRFEGCNETWNPGFVSTSFANRKATANWGSGDFTDWYGKSLANLGQICAGVYGGGNLGTTYHVLCGVWTVQGPSSMDEKLKSSKYIAQAAAADPALTGSWGTITFNKTRAAKLDTSHIAIATYISPSDRFSVNELVNGFSYSVANRGNTSAQATIANNYCDTLLGASSVFNLAWANGQYVAYKAWAAALGVTRMCGYEGGYSPDYLPGSGITEGDAWWSSPTGRTATNPATIQLSSTCSTSEGGAITGGNPGVVGMTVTFKATGTQFDNPGLEGVTFTAGSPNISGANTLVLNQTVYFRADTVHGGVMPTGTGFSSVIGLTTSPSTTFSDAYYVVSAGNPFQVSATRGGAAITFTTAGTNVFAQECWRITAVDSVNNRVTLDLNSTGFTAPTGGYMTYSKSQVYSNNLRFVSKLSPGLQGYTYGNTAPASNYLNFSNAGGEFPSNFLMGGLSPSGNAWSVLEPMAQSPNPPQWLAFIAYNH